MKKWIFLLKSQKAACQSSVALLSYKARKVAAVNECGELCTEVSQWKDDGPLRTSRIHISTHHNFSLLFQDSTKKPCTYPWLTSLHHKGTDSSHHFLSCTCSSMKDCLTCLFDTICTILNFTSISAISRSGRHCFTKSTLLLTAMAKLS